jgi:hypothetical protein
MAVKKRSTAYTICSGRLRDGTLCKTTVHVDERLCRWHAALQAAVDAENAELVRRGESPLTDEEVDDYLVPIRKRLRAERKRLH